MPALLTLSLVVFAVNLQGQSINIQEFGPNGEIFGTVIVGDCINPILADGATECPFPIRAPYDGKYTTPDGQFTVIASWSFTNLGGTQGIETLAYVVIDNKGEIAGGPHTLGITPFETYILMGSPVPLYGVAILTGNCSNGVAYGSLIDDDLNINGGFTTTPFSSRPVQINAPCPTQFTPVPGSLGGTATVSTLPYNTILSKPQTLFGAEVDFHFMPGSTPGSTEGAVITAKFGIPPFVFE
ncbi:MAG: hypothetical protein WCC92_07395 [Candidatus Korobacteraceae bacterium]